VPDSVVPLFPSPIVYVSVPLVSTVAAAVLLIVILVGVFTLVAAFAQLVVTHATPGVAGLAPPVGSTAAKFVIAPADAGAVVVIVNAAVPFAALAASPLVSVTMHVSSAPD